MDWHVSLTDVVVLSRARYECPYCDRRTSGSYRNRSYTRTALSQRIVQKLFTGLLEILLLNYNELLLVAF